MSVKMQRPETHQNAGSETSAQGSSGALSQAVAGLDGYAAQVQALSPAQLDPNRTVQAKSNDVDDFPTLLAAAAQTPAAAVTDEFLKELQDHADTLTSAQTITLVAIVRGTGRSEKIAIFKALDIPLSVSSGKFQGRPKLKPTAPGNEGNADYTEDDLVLRPGERVDGAEPDKKFKVDAKMKLIDDFSDEEINIVFESITKLPRAHWTDRTALTKIMPAPGRTPSTAIAKQARFTGREQYEKAVVNHYVDADYGAELSGAQALTADETQDRGTTVADAGEKAQTEAKAAWALRRGQALAKAKPLTKEEDKERADYISARPDDARAGTRWDQKRLTALGPKLHTKNKATKEELAAGDTEASATKKAAEDLSGRSWDAARGTKLAEATPEAADARTARVKKLTDEKFNGTVRHEMGHIYDNRDHAGLTFHEANGWQVFNDAASFVAFSDGFKGPTAEMLADADVGQYEKAALDILANKSVRAISTLDGSLAAAAKDESLGEKFVIWFKATKVYQVLAKSADHRSYTDRERVAGGLASRTYGAGMFMHMSTELSADVTSWNNFTAAFSPQEWAAEWYKAWFDVAKPGDDAGNGAHCGSAPPGVKDWLDGLE
ncbi:MAG: hypothetical protein ACI9MR_001371 [Myxococcota bacterium]|jgi:hypothetical protein